MKKMKKKIQKRRKQKQKQEQGNLIYVVGEVNAALLLVSDEAFQQCDTDAIFQKIETMELAGVISNVFNGLESLPEGTIVLYIHEYLRRSLMYKLQGSMFDRYCAMITTFRAGNGDFVTRPSMIIPLASDEVFEQYDIAKIHLKFVQHFKCAIPMYHADGYADDSKYHELVRAVRDLETGHDVEFAAAKAHVR